MICIDIWNENAGLRELQANSKDDVLAVIQTFLDDYKEEWGKFSIYVSSE